MNCEISHNVFELVLASETANWTGHLNASFTNTHPDAFRAALFVPGRLNSSSLAALILAAVQSFIRACALGADTGHTYQE